MSTSLTPVQINALIDRALSTIDPETVEAHTGLTDLPDHPTINHLIKTVSDALYDSVIDKGIPLSDISPSSFQSPYIHALLSEPLHFNSTPEEDLDLFLINYYSIQQPLNITTNPPIRDLPLLVADHIRQSFQADISTQLIQKFEDAFLGQSPFSSEYSKKLHGIPQLFWDEDRVEYMEI